MNPDTQHGARRREPEDLSPRCKSRRALSPGPTTSSDTTRDSVYVATLAPRSHLYGRGAASPPIDLPLSRFAEKEFIPEMLQSMWVATQEYPASPPSLASQSLCLNLDAMSSEDSEVGTGCAPAVDPVVISDQEFTVISVHSSDPDSSEVDCQSNARIELVSPIPTAIPGGVLESPSHYPTRPHLWNCRIYLRC